ncbi:MAG: hypothetical protein NVV57_11770 [Demequina sp.]|nr:hypothetical protein [Demequina sp.]
MSITELVISMAIFSMVIVVFLAAVSSMARSTVRSEATSDSASQMRAVFARFDKEVRYASDINTPGTANGNIYIEYLVPASAKDGEAMCVQWRYLTVDKKLQRRTWSPGDASTVTSWVTLVTKLRNDLSLTAEQPFTLHRAGTVSGKVYLHQTLDIFLDAGLSGSGDARGSQLDTTFVAQNSSTASVTNPGLVKVCLVGSVQRP